LNDIEYLGELETQEFEPVTSCLQGTSLKEANISAFRVRLDTQY